MKRSIILLLVLLQSCSAELTTILATRTCDALKIRCDSLPYRTVYRDGNCFFVIDAMTDAAATSKQCSLAMRGAILAPGAPDSVWAWLFADKNDYLLAGVAAVNKTKAMCSYEHAGYLTGKAPPCIPDSSIARTREGTCSALAKSKKKEAEAFWARIALWLNTYGNVIVELPARLEPGQEMIFKGVARPGSTDFALNFMSEANKFRQFQIYIVFTTKQVRLNSWANNAWGAAEIKAHSLVIGQPFDIIIRVREDHFKICIDGMDHAEYKFRQQLSSITHFEVISQYGFLLSYQLSKKYKAFPSVTGAEGGFPICNSTQPRNECKTLVVSGTVGSGFWRSIINIYRKNGDMNMHINFWYNKNYAYICIHSNGAFTHVAVVPPTKPYPKQGEPMEVEIVNEEGGFQVYVNGEDFFFYTHRIPSHDIAGVEVSNILEPLITFRPAKKHLITARAMIIDGIYSPMIVDLPEKLAPGKEMIFKAISVGNDFVINFQSIGGKSIQLQIWILFHIRQVRLNSFFTHMAGTAEIITHNLTVNRPFEIIIRTHEDHFKILIDGKDFAQYKYRQPIAFIQHFEIKGSAYLISYQLGEKQKAFPSVPPVESLPVCKNSVPRSECKTMVVSGLVGPEWNRGLINLYRRNMDIPLHINLMYFKNSVYLDTMTNGQWWAQRPEYFNIQYPKAGELLEMEIINGETAFQVFMNGKFFLNFTHRMPSFDISLVEVSDLREPTITIK